MPTYEIHIPAAKITPEILRDTYQSSRSCPLATYFTEQGYEVVIGEDYIWFFPVNIPAPIPYPPSTLNVGEDWRHEVIEINYQEELKRCSEAGEDFRTLINLPDDIYAARDDGTSKWRRKP